MQTLGFAYLNVDSVLFLWDQIFLKIEPMENDMADAFVALLLACREELLLCNLFSEVVQMVYMKGKATSIDAFIAKYIMVAAGTDFYKERWNYEEIPVESIKLDKINLGPKLETGYGQGGTESKAGTGTSPAEDKILEENMDRIMRDNVLPQDDELFDVAEGNLMDPSLLKDLDNVATGRKASKKGTKGSVNPLDDYKSVKPQDLLADLEPASSRKSHRQQNDILSDMPKAKPKSNKASVQASANPRLGGSRDKLAASPKSSKKSFSLQQSQSSGVTKKTSKAKSGVTEQEEEEMEEEASKTAKSKISVKSKSGTKNSSKSKKDTEKKSASKSKSPSASKTKKDEKKKKTDDEKKKKKK